MKTQGLKRASMLSLGALLACSAVGCNKKPIITDTETDSKRIEVQVFIAGFDTDWLHALETRFEDIYKDEGYDIVITEEELSINAMNEIRNPNKCTTDIFFEYNLIDEIVPVSQSVLKKEGVALLEDLTSVFDSPALDANKQEEGLPIKERFTYDGMLNMMSYKGDLQGYDGYYGLPWEGGSQGVYVNKRVLEENGYTIDDLLTTDDLLKVVDALAPEPTVANLTNPNLFFPVSWSGGVAPGYWRFLMLANFAQYEGLESFNNFMELIPDSGTTIENGYEVYNKQGIYESLKVVNELLNKDYCVPGTASMDHVTAEARVATGDALIVPAGDYIYKELEKDYSDELNDVYALKTPVISALGIKLNLCGAQSHAEDASCETCNTILREIVKAVDAESLTDAQIASELNGKGYGAVTEDDVARIREARGYWIGNTGEVMAFIPSYSDAKKGAKLFLRYMYSDEGMKIFKENTYVDLPLYYTVEPEPYTTTPMISMDKKMRSDNSQMFLISSHTSRLREVIGNQAHFPYPGSYPSMFTGLSYSHSQSSSAQFTVKKLCEMNAEWVKNSWMDYLYQADLLE